MEERKVLARPLFAVNSLPSTIRDEESASRLEVDEQRVARKEMRDGGRGSDVWQTKELWEGVFGSVAMIGVTCDFSEVWQIQELAAEEVKPYEDSEPEFK